LVREYNLQLEGREKPVMTCDDFYEYIATVLKSDQVNFPAYCDFTPMRQRMTLWQLELHRCATAGRIGALVEVPRADNSPSEMLKSFHVPKHEYAEPPGPTYGDCQLLLIPRPHGGRDALILGIKHRRTKGAISRTKP
jgi:hypothetical protein